jgi:hypothetical protein
MTQHSLSRRSVLKGGAALAGSLILPLPPVPLADATEEGSSLVVFWLNGGPAGLFNSADSFLATGAFGVTTNAVRALGNGLFVDAGSLGAFPDAARAHMASINFRHDVVRPHEHARAAVLEAGPQSQLLRVAAAMPKGRNRCAVVNDLGLPVGVSAAPSLGGGTGFDRVLDLEEALGAPAGTPADDVRAAYGLARGVAAVRDQLSTFVAVELLVRRGAGVVFAQPAYTGRPDRQFDTHGDDTGQAARAIMAPITPSLATFLDRMLALPGRNVVTMLVGEFSRTVPESDHEPGGTATVVGKYVRAGTAGRQTADGAPPPGAPRPEGLWAYAAAALRLTTAPFGRNPNPELIL